MIWLFADGVEVIEDEDENDEEAAEEGDEEEEPKKAKPAVNIKTRVISVWHDLLFQCIFCFPLIQFAFLTLSYISFFLAFLPHSVDDYMCLHFFVVVVDWTKATIHIEHKRQFTLENIQEELERPRFKDLRLQIMAFNSLLNDRS